MMQNPNFSGKFPKSSCPQPPAVYLFIVHPFVHFPHSLILTIIFYYYYFTVTKWDYKYRRVRLYLSKRLQPAGVDILKTKIVYKQCHYKSGYDENT
jgi:hypothetical protein